MSGLDGYCTDCETRTKIHNGRCSCGSGRVIAAAEARAFALGDRVTKTRGSCWTGRVVGFYSTTHTPAGYCVESETELGSVQIYPEAALKLMPGPIAGGKRCESRGQNDERRHKQRRHR